MSSKNEPSSCHSDDLESINSIESVSSTESFTSTESESAGSIVSTESSMSVVSLGDDEVLESADSPIDIVTEEGRAPSYTESNYSEVSADEDSFSIPFESPDNDNIPAPPPSWTSSVEAFISQLNDYNNDNGSSDSFELCEFKGLGEMGDSEDEERVMGTQKFLTYLAVPVLISQILMIIILTSASNSNVNGGSNLVIPIVRPTICTIHRHHHVHHYHQHFYFSEEEETSDGTFSKRFLHIFFNPFSVLSNSKFYKKSAEWFTEQANDPTSIIGQFFKYLDSYLRLIQIKFDKLNNVVCSGLDMEIGKTLAIRDKWTKGVYDKIYKIAATPQYKRAVSTVSKWASAVKDRLFSSN